MFYGNEERDSIFYKSDDMRKPEYSVYLEDYIDVGVFGDDDNNELYLKNIKLHPLIISCQLFWMKSLLKLVSILITN